MTIYMYTWREREREGECETMNTVSLPTDLPFGRRNPNSSTLWVSIVIGLDAVQTSK